ncbi:NAD(P)/FAD-dependent oxidoreductase [Marinisporobacter balticus]|uniref:Glycerol-3-phosphate dehydrogenase n=1 Tax=Marinisporobacter balticus TaxID=2018667 RepID=A0A4R2L7I3_9FIRM|nr:NAD(P)/FAD-dependent oxidoreductase [Marinisporobacter balticus]TCO75185.1 glycerol-3-phosphate dehydrogenase [Marinisporobacter balticus]
MYDVAIIGAGITGTFIARELSRYKLRTVILEKDNDVANGTTKANSAIVHAGYDATVGSNKAKFNVLGNVMFDKVCEELDVPFKRIGSLVVAFDEEDMNTIQTLYENGIKIGVPDMEMIDAKEVKKMEPNLNDLILGALYAPTAGIVGPFELATALAENALDNGAELLLNNEVKRINKAKGGYKIYTNENIINTKYIINCAGVYADHIYSMVTNSYFKIVPRRGQYYLLDKSAGDIVNKVIFQCPTKLGKGVLISPTVDGNIIIGPDAANLEDKEDVETTSDGLSFVQETAIKTCSKIPFNKNITTFAGLRAEPSTGDFIIEESAEAKGFINVAGIKSPGLSSSPAIAKYVVERVKSMAGHLDEKEDFNPRRRKRIRFAELSDEEKAEIIKKDPRYGRIICRCETITEGEIVDAIHRNAGAKTVNGVKRRVRPGAGRCQGGFCGPRVMEILAREQGKDMKAVVKEGTNSYILIGDTKEDSEYEITKEFVASSCDA